VITGHLREDVLFSLNQGMSSLSNYASGVAAVLYKDMAYWQHNCGIPAPEVWWHSQLFGGSRTPNTSAVNGGVTHEGK
jgi:hypothetical protein